MRTLITVMAHREAQDTFNRHFPFWWNLGHDMLVACPERQGVALPEMRGGTGKRLLTTFNVGKAEHHGVQSILRFRAILEQMSGAGYDRYAFFEYDALCLANDLPPMFADVVGNVFTDSNTESGFVGGMFVHPPIMFTAPALEWLVKIMETQMSLADEKSVWDRWIGLALKKSNLTVGDLIQNGRGYSMNTIPPEKHEELFLAIRNGAVLVHGVKTPECLEVCKKGMALRASVEHVESNGGAVAWKEKPSYSIS
jgi:hypothetical protein